MLDGLSDIYASLWSNYGLVYAKIGHVASHIDAMATAIGNQQWGLAYIQGHGAATDLHLLKSYFANTTNSVRVDAYDAFELIDENWTAAEELTAITICEAWAKDGFKERALTIAFIDRMRQLIWDEPFRVVWAARPEEVGD